ncbi:MAG: Recombination protein RecR [Parcubacteria group bacterium GW2011_GWA2_50_10b]|nr:MAG: Recombination protein RecR [Parcubacteria group bacterium GW2011_GWA2_50_10b]
MNSIDKLTEIFSKFPGIGPRQAKRFVYFILSRSGDYAGELTRAVLELKKEIVQCARCLRFFAKNGHDAKLCSVCSDDTRDSSMLMIVPRDIDFEAVEKSGSFKGYYFILGGVIPILEKEPEKRIRNKELGIRIKEGIKNGLKEIVIAMNANQDGENTAEYLKEKLKNFELQTSVLGRGLSTGTELEYADPETLKNAFLHRTNNIDTS